MQTIADRINLLRRDLGVTQSELGALAGGVTKSAVSQWERGITAPDWEQLFALQLARQINPFWVMYGVEPKYSAGPHHPRDPTHPVSTLPDPANVSPGPPLRGRVPLVSWVRAGEEREAIDLHAPGQAEEWVETTVQVRAHTYALRVEGDSMAPLFPPGVLLVVEPELDPLAGDYVIAKNGEGEVSFKQLVRDGGDWYLKPLNERYPIKPLGAAKIIGVVREAVQRFR